MFCSWRLDDQINDVVQASGVLPAPGLVSPDEPSQDAGVPNAIVQRLDRPAIQAWHRHEVADQVDILIARIAGNGTRADASRRARPGTLQRLADHPRDGWFQLTS
ncbi:MAG TPA: hypothetical protein PLS90_04225 [Candidatus Sumerlaeota bacterium]|nr:hypothetical protein [Candidatus Sumerlaeota bacterium]HPK01644.1 hypothetical protein [Candidatus Sumerlaeota bacterium]